MLYSPNLAAMWKQFRKHVTAPDANHRHTRLPFKSHELKGKDAGWFSVLDDASGPEVQYLLANRDYTLRPTDSEELYVKLGYLRVGADSPPTIEAATNGPYATRQDASQRGNGSSNTGPTQAPWSFGSGTGSSQGNQYQGSQYQGDHPSGPPNSGNGRPSGRQGAPNLIPRPTGRGPSELPLACPFAKLHVRSHMRCSNKSFPRMPDVLQHLSRTHLVHSYCPICHEIFGDDAQFRAHVRAQRCAPSSRPLPGVTPAQVQRINDASRRQRTLEGKWMEAWHLLFPGVAPPANPYYTDDWPLEWSSKLIRTFFEGDEGRRAFLYLYSGEVVPTIDQMEDELKHRMLKFFERHFIDYPIPPPRVRQ